MLLGGGGVDRLVLSPGGVVVLIIILVFGVLFWFLDTFMKRTGGRMVLLILIRSTASKTGLWSSECAFSRYVIIFVLGDGKLRFFDSSSEDK